ncbi:MAG: ester cyclase [Actinomycetota bacterium]|nr:ester cyclase [Actinomycetota bacterium]
MTDDDMRDVLTRSFVAISSGDIEAVLGFYTDDSTGYEPGLPEPMRGLAQLRQFFEQLMGPFDHLCVIDDEVFTAENRAAVRWTGRGVSKSGKLVRFQGVDTYEFDDAGKIRNQWAYYDPAAVAAQL